MHPETQIEATQASLFLGPIAKLFELQDALKEDRKMLREKESDLPMALEELILQLRDLKEQVAEQRELFMQRLLEDTDYRELRSRIQEGKEEVAKHKLGLRMEVSEGVKRAGDQLDLTVMVNGEPFRLQTQAGTEIYINGKTL